MIYLFKTAWEKNGLLWDQTNVESVRDWIAKRDRLRSAQMQALAEIIEAGKAAQIYWTKLLEEPCVK